MRFRATPGSWTNFLLHGRPRRVRGRDGPPPRDVGRGSGHAVPAGAGAESAPARPARGRAGPPPRAVGRGSGHAVPAGAVPDHDLSTPPETGHTPAPEPPAARPRGRASRA